MTNVLIANPESLGRHPQLRVEKILSAITSKIDEVVFTKNYSDIEYQARKALSTGASTILVAGGDGTTSKAAAGFFSDGVNQFPDANLGLIPTGTGCDYFRSISNGDKWNQIINDRQSMFVDVGSIELDSRQIIFLNLLSIGISAEIVKRKSTLPKWVPKTLSYLIPTLLTIPSFQPVNISLKSLNHSGEFKFWSWFLSNGAYAGGGMKLGFPNNLSSSKLGSLMIKPVDRLKLFFNLPLLYSKKILNSTIIEKQSLQNFSIVSKNRISLEYDGECLPFTSVKIKIIPSSLRVICSKSIQQGSLLNQNQVK